MRRSFFTVTTTLIFLFQSSCSLLQMTDAEEKSSETAAAKPTPPPAPPKSELQSAMRELHGDPNKPDYLKKRILVVQFSNRSRQPGDDLSLYATQLVKNALDKDGNFILVPSEELEGHDAFVDQFGEFDMKLIFEKARARSISGIIIGSIQDIVSKGSEEPTGLFRLRSYTVTATLKLQLFDCVTEREVMQRIASAEVVEEHTDYYSNRGPSGYDYEKGRGAVTKALEKVIPTLPEYAAKVAWMGRIAKVDIHRYYINAGERSGIVRGQLLKVYEDGKPVFDPDAKTMLGIAPGRFKGLLKVVDHFGPDGSVAIVHSGGGFRERDRVEIFNSLQK